jgi:hypothetical protein
VPPFSFQRDTAPKSPGSKLTGGNPSDKDYVLEVLGATVQATVLLTTGPTLGPTAPPVRNPLKPNASRVDGDGCARARARLAAWC